MTVARVDVIDRSVEKTHVWVIWLKSSVPEIGSTLSECRARLRDHGSGTAGGITANHVFDHPGSVAQRACSSASPLTRRATVISL